MTYAIIETCGKQYRVEQGSKLRVDAHLDKPGAEISLDKVLMVKTDTGVKVGNPLIAGAKVTAEVLLHDRGRKIIVFKKRSKKTYKKTQGHRQDFTDLLIKSIQA
jgi:large subunit ribosomal protein L21